MQKNSKLTQDFESLKLQLNSQREDNLNLKQENLRQKDEISALKRENLSLKKAVSETEARLKRAEKMKENEEFGEKLLGENKEFLRKILLGGE